MNWNPIINKITYTDNLYRFKNSGNNNKIRKLPYFDQMKQLSFKTTDDIVLLKIDEGGNVFFNTGLVSYGNLKLIEDMQKQIREMEIKISKLTLKINELQAEIFEEKHSSLKEELEKLNRRKANKI